MNKPAQVRLEGDEVIVTMDREALTEMDGASLFDYLNLIIGLVKGDELMPEIEYNPPKVEGRRPRIAVFMESSIHFSGGRYWIILASKLLSSVADVVVFTNRKTKWHNIVKDMNFGGDFEIRIHHAFKAEDNNFDLVIGTPKLGLEIARGYARKWEIPLIAFLFESPNFIRHHLGSSNPDANENVWKGYKLAMADVSKVICLTAIATEYARVWLDGIVDKDKFTFVYPCISEHIAKIVAASMPMGVEKENAIVFLSRQSSHKMPIAEARYLKEIKDSPPKIYILGYRAMDVAKLLAGYGGKVEAHEGIDDMGKFAILAKSKVLLYPSRFDGFGIPPMEALYMGIPVVAYDLPVLKEVYGDAIKYVEMNNAKAFVDVAMEMVRGRVDIPISKVREKIMSIATLESGRRRITDAIFPLKLSVGILAFNCADTIGLCLKHIYDIADEIIVVEGAVKDFAFAATETGHSTDDTLEMINDFQLSCDPKEKLKVISKGKSCFWQDKVEMQNAIAKEVTGDIYMKLDADEFYHMSDIYGILDEFRSNMQLTMVRVGMYHFWKSPTVVAVGGQWDSRPVRFWRWDSAFRNEDSFNCFVKDGVRVEYPVFKEKVFGRICYHLSYARDSKYVLDKLIYYRNRGLEKFVTDTWSNWEWGMPTQPTHGGGTAELFGGPLPDAVKEFFDKQEAE